MYFCIRDDDTNYFTSPDELERAYGEITKYGPVSLAIVPFCRAGTSEGLPLTNRGSWTIHPLGENTALVKYLRDGIQEGRYEAMLHGYHHDEPHIPREFVGGTDLRRKVRDGKEYLENLLHTKIHVFVPPHNAIDRRGLQAITQAGLHLGTVAGMRSGWSWMSSASLKTWWRLRQWRSNGRVGIPWVLNLAGHKELAGNPITPTSTLQQSIKAFDEANAVGGVFCAATHYWELDHLSADPNSGTVKEHLKNLVERAITDPKIRWVSVGSVLCGTV
jgi:hypothetical protein